jgi:hypothetical protein
VGTDSCQDNHLGYVVEANMIIRHETGAEQVI